MAQICSGGAAPQPTAIGSSPSSLRASGPLLPVPLWFFAGGAMRVRTATWIGVFFACACLRGQTPRPPALPSGEIRVTLLGTAGGPPVSLERAGISTLVEAGGDRFLFDAGRSLMKQLVRAGLPMD